MSIILKPMASAILVSKEVPSNRRDAAGAMPDRIEAWPLRWTRFAFPSPIALHISFTATLSDVSVDGPISNTHSFL